MTDLICVRCQESDTYLRRHCPHCGSCPEFQTIKNYDPAWHDGQIYCLKCQGFVREYDAD